MKTPGAPLAAGSRAATISLHGVPAVLLLALRHALVAPSLSPAALLGNYAGVAFGARLPQRAFRYLALACAAGVVTALTA